MLQLLTALLSLISCAGSAEQCTVTTTSEELKAELVGWSEGRGLQFRSEGRDFSVLQKDIVEILWSRKRPEARGGGYAALSFVNGDRAYGTIGESLKGGFLLESLSCGALPVNLKDLKLVLVPQAETPAEATEKLDRLAREPSRKTDTVVLVNGDALPCAVEEVSSSGAKIESELGPLKIPLKRIHGLAFAALPGKSVPRKEIVVSTETLHGELLSGRLSAGKDGRLVLISEFGSRVEVPIDQLLRMSFKNGAVVYLSDLKPERVVETPFFEVNFPYKQDLSVGGNPLRLRGKTYRRGLGVHSKSEMTYALGGSFSKFAATLGIDDEVGPRGSAIFVVLGDGKELYRSPDIVGQGEPVKLEVEVAGMRRLTLIVDFGKAFHIADHADWADARLLR